MTSSISHYQGIPLTPAQEARARHAAARTAAAAETPKEQTTTASGAATGAANAAETPKEKADEGMSFWDVLDVINPLQHIPVVNRIYRAITGDEIKTPAKMAGAALLFGPVGLAVAAADSVLENATGKDAMGHAMALFKDDAAEAPATAYAQAAPQQPAPQQVAQQQERPAPAQAQAQVADAGMTRQALERRQAAELAEGPAASAARAALAGLPASAAVGTLPAPGAGADASTLAALSDKATAKPEPGAGKGLNQYRQLSVGQVPPTAMKPYVPPAAVQAALQEREKPGAAIVSRVSNPALVTEAAQRSAAEAMNPPTTGLAAAPAAEQAPQARPIGAAQTPAQTAPQGGQQTAQQGGQQKPGAWPPGGSAPLPPALIADMMSMAMDKYEAQARTRQPTPSGSAVNGKF